MLDEHIDERLTTIERGGEQQVRMPPSQGRIDEAARNSRQPIQVEPHDQCSRQHRAQLRPSVGGFAENPTKHCVMRTWLTGHVIEHICEHRHARAPYEPRWEDSVSELRRLKC